MTPTPPGNAPPHLTLIGPEAHPAAVCEPILRALPGWFGIESAIRDYVRDIDRWPTFLAREGEAVVGFATLRPRSPHAAEIHVMGVRPDRHRAGVGRALVAALEAHAHRQGIRFLQVKTLSPARESAEYAATRAFYLALGFVPLEEHPTLWGPANPALQLVKTLVPLAPCVRPAGAADREAIEALHAEAFGQPDEARLVARLHAAGVVTASLMAVIAGEIVGHVLLSRLEPSGDAAPLSVVGLAPIGVRPAHQRRGVGAALVRAALADATASGAEVAVVVGDPRYYGRFGFSATLARRLDSPYGGPAFMAMELRSGALGEVARGAVRYPRPFEALDEAPDERA